MLGPANPGRKWFATVRPFLAPGPADLVFGLVLLLVLIGGRHGLFADPGTPWHYRLGREILASGTVPHLDTFTYTRAGADWVDQSWGFDILLALVVGGWGWPGVLALSALGLAALYAAMARDLLRDGASPPAAIVATILAMAIGSIHFLARPHLFTLGFVYLTFRACRRQHEQGGRAVFLVPLYTAILANLHGGFVILPMVVATSAIGHAIAGPWDPGRRSEVSKFAASAILSMLAALANPYGTELYVHVADLLVSSGVTGLIIEYQPPAFGKPEAEVLEWVVLGLIALPVISTRRMDRYQLIHVLVWLHLALTTIRNAPIFAMAAAPALATMIDGLPISDSLRRPWRTSRLGWIWPPLATIGLLLAAGFDRLPGGLDPVRWPLSAMAALDRQTATARLFHEQDWGGLIESESLPVRRAYLDDRFELFGKETIVEYVDALTGGPAWDRLRDREGIDLVWIRPERGLAKRMLREPGWSVVHRDRVSILFRRVDAGGLASR